MGTPCEDEAGGDGEIQGGDAASDAGSALEQSFETFVAEAGHLKELVAAIDEDEGIVERICTILDRYQEQPQLLDPHIESIVTPLAATLRSGCGIDVGGGAAPAEQGQIRRASRALYVLAKVRGFKVVIKFFPHSVADLEPCLDLLDKQDMLGNRWLLAHTPPCSCGLKITVMTLLCSAPAALLLGRCGFVGNAIRAAAVALYPRHGAIWPQHG